MLLYDYLYASNITPLHCKALLVILFSLASFWYACFYSFHICNRYDRSWIRNVYDRIWPYFSLGDISLFFFLFIIWKFCYPTVFYPYLCNILNYILFLLVSAFVLNYFGLYIVSIITWTNYKLLKLKYF